MEFNEDYESKSVNAELGTTISDSVSNKGPKDSNRSKSDTSSKGGDNKSEQSHNSDTVKQIRNKKDIYLNKKHKPLIDPDKLQFPTEEDKKKYPYFNENYMVATLVNGCCVIDAQEDCINSLLNKLFGGPTLQQKPLQYDRDILIESILDCLDKLEFKITDKGQSKYDCLDYICWFFNIQIDKQNFNKIFKDIKGFLTAALPEQIFLESAPVFTNCSTADTKFYWTSYYSNEYNAPHFFEDSSKLSMNNKPLTDSEAVTEELANYDEN